MESFYNFFKKSNEKIPSCTYQLSPEISQNVKDNFVDIRFWLAASILAETEDQYVQAFQNSDMLNFVNNQGEASDLGQKIKERLVDPSYLKEQIQSVENNLTIQAKDPGERHLYSVDVAHNYNCKILNEYNLNLLLGQSLFSDCLIQKTLDFMPQLTECKNLKYWSLFFVDERPDLAELLEELYSDLEEDEA